MPRPLRLIQAGAVYHVLNRANGRRRIFRKPQDFQAFVDVLSLALQRFGVDLLAWCLMGNHWHLVLRPRRADELAKFMQWLTLTHARRHHGHHGRAVGHVYQGRYKHFCVSADEYFLTLCRYVEANALRAGLVKRAQDWRWSSLHQRLARAGAGDPPLGDWPVDRPGNWTALVNQDLDRDRLEQVRRSVVRERPLGPPGWVKATARRSGLEQSLRDLGRPRQPIERLSARQRRRRAKQERKGGGRIGT